MRQFDLCLVQQRVALATGGFRGQLLDRRRVTAAHPLRHVVFQRAVQIDIGIGQRHFGFGRQHPPQVFAQFAGHPPAETAQFLFRLQPARVRFASQRIALAAAPERQFKAGFQLAQAAAATGQAIGLVAHLHRGRRGQQAVGALGQHAGFVLARLWQCAAGRAGDRAVERGGQRERRITHHRLVMLVGMRRRQLGGGRQRSQQKRRQNERSEHGSGMLWGRCSVQCSALPAGEHNMNDDSCCGQLAANRPGAV